MDGRTNVTKKSTFFIPNYFGLEFDIFHSLKKLVTLLFNFQTLHSTWQKYVTNGEWMYGLFIADIILVRIL